METLINDAINAVFFAIIVFSALVLTTFFVGLTTYGLILLIRMKKREKISLETQSLEIRVPKDNEVKIDTAEQMFSALSSISRKSGITNILEVGDNVCFEIVAREGEIRFVLSTPNKLRDLLEKQIYSFYPTADIRVVDEPNIFAEKGSVAFAALKKKDVSYNPIKTYKELPTDSLSTITTALSKMGDDEGAIVQILIRKAGGDWKKAGKSYLSSTKKKEASPDDATFKIEQRTLEKISDTVSKTGFETTIRIVISGESKDSAEMHLKNIKSAFIQFESDLNSFTGAPILFKYGFMINFIYKFFPVVEIPFKKTTSILSTEELATIFHFPNRAVETPHINWLRAKTAPVAFEIPDEGMFIGWGRYRGVRRKVCIKKKDRLRHIYIIGKTGTGKSVLLQEMARQDIEDGHGICVIDPHGDLVEGLLDFIPPKRAEDVIYFDPSDTERPMGLNLLEAYGTQQRHFMTSAIINLMYKLYDPQRTGIIGPRFEHNVRNAMLTVMEEPGSTFVELYRSLTDPKYVQELLPKVKDPIVRRYWTDQMAQTSEFHKSEILDYMVSKFGRFVTNTDMRNIVGQSKSVFDFRKVMDEGKILLINLSKGKLGEENANFLGLVLIPKILVAAMSRQDVPEEQRRDFFLYVDEFQNYATPDFATILSEARKYRLGLTVANQFIGQIEEEVKNAIFGNVGTIMAYRVGVTDASYLAREFQPVFNETDLMNIDRFHIYMKTIVDNEPMPAFTVDLSRDMKQIDAERSKKVSDALRQLSRLKYGRPRELVEAEITQRSGL